jgi:hypothetical protein
MLIKCPCGATLKMQDDLAGRKVRCPTCAEVFIAQEHTDAKGSIQTGKKEQLSRSRNDDLDAIQHQRPPKKVNKTRDKRFDEDLVDEGSKEAPNHGRRIAGWVCCGVAAGLFLAGLRSVLVRGPGLADPSGLGVSHAVGGFLPFMLVLILGVWLLSKKKTPD